MIDETMLCHSKDGSIERTVRMLVGIIVAMLQASELAGESVATIFMIFLYYSRIW